VPVVKGPATVLRKTAALLSARNEPFIVSVAKSSVYCGTMNAYW